MVISERVHGINFSLDGARAQTHDRIRGVKGTWKRTLKGIRTLQNQVKLKGRGPKIGINTLVTRENIKEIPELFPLLVSLNIDRWRLLPVDWYGKQFQPDMKQWMELVTHWDEWKPIMTRKPFHWLADNPEKSARWLARGRYAGNFYETHTCFAPWFNIFIDANGAVYPCCTGKGHMQTYGNIMEHPLEELLVSRARREICATMAAGRVFDICSTCDDYLEENEAFENIIAKKEQS
jgi:radical SAM protein with 4Fe4S-binding SPASM domain